MPSFNSTALLPELTFAELLRQDDVITIYASILIACVDK